MSRGFVIDEPLADKVQLVPFSDIHIGAESHAARHFARSLEWVKRNRAYWGFGGDGMENVTPDKGGDQLLDQRMDPTKQFLALSGHFKKIANRCTYIIEGNHEKRTVREAMLDTTMLFAQQLDRLDRYYEVGGMMKVRVGKEVYRLTVYHGASNARVNRFLEHERRFSIHPFSDIVLLGHTHFLGYESRITLDVDEAGKEYAKPVYFVRTGTYLKYAKYAREKGYPPGRIGSPIVTFYGTERKITVDDQTLAAV